MELGEKIRQARLEAGLSQRQLCGEEITRNMLSQIENGSARPSMDTLRYFANRLGKPISWFLEEQAVLLPNRQRMQQAREAFAQGQYRQVTQLLEDYKAPDPVYDPECRLLEAISLTEQAKQALAQEKTVYAIALLEKAREIGEKTPYFAQTYLRQWLLTAAQADPEKATQLVQQLPEDDRELLLRAQAAMQEEKYLQSACLLDAAQNRDERWHLLRGQAAMGQRQYAVAAEHYLQAEGVYPVACARALETCYREMEDYKNAYYYACRLRQL